MTHTFTYRETSSNTRTKKVPLDLVIRRRQQSLSFTENSQKPKLRGFKGMDLKEMKTGILFSEKQTRGNSSPQFIKCEHLSKAVEGWPGIVHAQTLPTCMVLGQLCSFLSPYILSFEIFKSVQYPAENHPWASLFPLCTGPFILRSFELLSLLTCECPNLPHKQEAPHMSTLSGTTVVTF